MYNSYFLGNRLISQLKDKDLQTLGFTQVRNRKGERNVLIILSMFQAISILGKTDMGSPTLLRNHFLRCTDKVTPTWQHQTMTEVCGFLLRAAPTD